MVVQAEDKPKQGRCSREQRGQKCCVSLSRQAIELLPSQSQSISQFSACCSPLCCSQVPQPGPWPHMMEGILTDTARSPFQGESLNLVPQGTSRKNQEAVFFLVNFQPDKQIYVYRIYRRIQLESLEYKTIFFLSFDFQRGRHWGMESQNKILLCIPETQNNRGSLTTTKTNFSEKNFFSLRKEKEERQSPNFYAWQVLCECGQLNLILLASVRLPKSLRARVTEGSPRRESLSFLGCSQGGLQSNLGI